MSNVDLNNMVEISPGEFIERKTWVYLVCVIGILPINVSSYLKRQRQLFTYHRSFVGMPLKFQERMTPNG